MNTVVKIAVWLATVCWLALVLLSLQGCAAGLVIGYLAAKSEQSSPAPTPSPTVVIAK